MVDERNEPGEPQVSEPDATAEERQNGGGPDEPTGEPPREVEVGAGDGDGPERPNTAEADGGRAPSADADDGSRTPSTDDDDESDGGRAPSADADEDDRPRGPRIEMPADLGESAPRAGAGEGVVRALAQLREAHDALERSQTEQKSAEDRLVRLAAEFENFKKRMGREREDDRKYANEKILKELLPVVDNLERALSVGEKADGDQVLTGVQMVHRQLIDTLKKFGVTQFSAAGEKFNPERHEAMQQVETDEADPGSVVNEFMKGFELHGRLLRPAMVVVAKAPADGGEKAPSESSGGGSNTGDER